MNEFIRIVKDIDINTQIRGTSANSFEKEFFTKSNKFDNYEEIKIKYNPPMEECGSDKTLVYNYTYKIEKYDDVKSKLVLTNFKVMEKTKCPKCGKKVKRIQKIWNHRLH